MSKTLFNQNTFNNKNVTNSNTITDVKVDTLKATNATIINATITNLTNAELQAATAGVAENASDIADNTTAISTNTSNIATNTTNISNNTSAISTNTSNISTNTSNIATNTTNISNNTSAISTNTSNISTNTSDITDLQNDKQNNLTADEGINITNDVISFDGNSLTQNINTTGSITANGGVRALSGSTSNSLEENVAFHANFGSSTTVNSSKMVLRKDNGNFYGAEILGGLDSGTSSSTRGLDDLSGTEFFAINQVASGNKVRRLTIDRNQGTFIDSNLTVVGDANIDSDADVGGDLSVVGNITTTTGTITGSVLQYSDGGPVANVKTKIDDLESNKQDNISAGDGISISGTTISVAQIIPNDTRINGGLLVDANSGSTSIISIEDGLKVRSVGNLVDFSVLGGNTNINGILDVGQDANFAIDINVSGDADITGDLTIGGTISGTTNFEVLKTGTPTGNDFFICSRSDIDGTTNGDELVLSPSINDGETSQDGRLHLGGYRDTGRGTKIQTSRNHYYSDSHHFYLDHENRYSFYNAYLNLINQINDGSIVNNIPELSSTHTYFVDGIRIGFTGNPSTTIGEGRGHYIGILNNNSSNSAYIAFGKDGGGGNDPDIGFAVSPSEGTIYSGGDLYLTGEFRGGGRRGGIRASLINYDNDSTNTGNFGNNSYFNSINTTESGRLGDSMFSSTTNGILTLSVGGTFRITVYNHGENVNVNDRVVAGTYLSINDGAGDWRGANAGKFGLMYLRDNNFGVGGSCSYACVVELSSGDSIRIKTKLGVGSDNRAYNDQKTTAQVNIWCQVAVELLTENNVIEAL